MLVRDKTVLCAVDQEVIFIPTGDHHYNTRDCDKSRLKGLVNWCVEKEAKGAKVFWLGTGDYLDSFSPSERKRLNEGYGMHDTTKEWLDNAVMRDIEEYAELMKPVAHQWLGLLTGHHEHIFMFGDLFGKNSDEVLADKLGCEWLGDGTVLLTLSFHDKEHRPYNVKFTVYASHGYGSARTEGARVIKRIRMAKVILDANLYVMAHDDDKMVYPLEPLLRDPSSPDGIRYLKQYFIGVGGFQRSYRVGEKRAGYVEKLLLPPAQLGVNIVNMHVEYMDLERKFRLDYHVSV